jgi:hypothetical protein
MTEINNIANMLNTVTTWLLVLVPVIAGVSLVILNIQKMMSATDGDPGEMAQKNKMMKTVLISAAIAFAASGIVKALIKAMGPNGG